VRVEIIFSLGVNAGGESWCDASCGYGGPGLAFENDQLVWNAWRKHENGAPIYYYYIKYVDESGQVVMVAYPPGQPPDPFMLTCYSPVVNDQQVTFSCNVYSSGRANSRSKGLLPPPKAGNQEAEAGIAWSASIVPASQ
jgi:hypothetical protein